MITIKQRIIEKWKSMRDESNNCVKFSSSQKLRHESFTKNTREWNTVILVKLSSSSHMIFANNKRC
jgi:hypothetical protein